MSQKRGRKTVRAGPWGGVLGDRPLGGVLGDRLCRGVLGDRPWGGVLEDTVLRAGVAIVLIICSCD